MQVSPTDIQAWAAATGSQYPATPADKAAVLPAVAAWKAQNQASARESRGQNAISPLAVGAGAAGLGLAGLLAFKHFRQQGLSEPVAAAYAKQHEESVRAEAPSPPPAPPVTVETVHPAPPVPSAFYETTRGRNPVAVTRNEDGSIARQNAVLAGASRSGTNQSRLAGEYATNSVFNHPEIGPLLANANTLEQQQAVIDQISESHPQEVDRAVSELNARRGGVVPVGEVTTASKLPSRAADGTAIRVADTRETLVYQGGKWLSASAAGVRKRMAPTGSSAYGSVELGEIAAEGGTPFQLGRRNSGAMFQPGWSPDSLIFDDNGKVLGDDELGSYRLDSAVARPRAEKALQEQRAAKAAELVAAGKHDQAAQLIALGSNIRDANLGNQESKSDFRPKYAVDANGQMLVDDNGFPVPVKGPNGEKVFVHQPQADRQNLANIYADTEDTATTGLMEGLPASAETRVGTPKGMIPTADGTADQFYGFDTSVRDRYKLGDTTYKGSIFDLEIGNNKFSYLDRRSKRVVGPDGEEKLVTEVGPASAKEGWHAAVPAVQGLSLLTPGHSFVQADNAWYPVVPAAESTQAYQGLKAEYHQQAGATAALSPANEEALRNHSAVRKEQQTQTQYFDLYGNPRTLPSLYNKQTAIPRAVQRDGQWVAPLQSVPTRSEDGSVLFDSRPALATDLLVFSENTQAPTGLYFGKTASQVAGAQQAPFQDYSKPGLMGRAVYTDQKPFIQTEPTAPLPNAAGLFSALRQAKTKELGRPLTSEEETFLADLASRGGRSTADPRIVAPTDLVDAAGRLHGGVPVTPGAGFEAPPASAVGGHTSKDWATQVLSSMAATPREDSWQVDEFVKSTDPQDKAKLAASWLNANPGVAETLSSNLSGTSLVEQFGIVAEAYGAAAHDFGKAIEWSREAHPDLADRAGFGVPGGFGFDQFAKSYVRRHVIGRVAELKGGSGANASPLNLPSAVGELILGEAVATKQRPEAVLQKHVTGAASPMDAVWKLDGIVSNAATDRVGNQSYTNGSLLAERFWDEAPKGTQVAGLKSQLGTKTDATYEGGGQVPLGEPPVARLPIAVKFGTNLKIDSQGFLNHADANAQSDQLIADAVTNRGVATTIDDSVVDKNIAPSPKTGSSLSVALGESGGARQFALNTVLKNQHQNLMKDISQIKEDHKNGLIDDDARDVSLSKVNKRMDKLVARQKSIDTNRVSVEQGIGSFNREGTDATGGAMGSGFVLDYHPVNGTVQVQPDTFVPTVSFDSLQRETDTSEGTWDQDTLDNAALEQGQSFRHQDDDGVVLPAAVEGMLDHDRQRLANEDIDRQVANAAAKFAGAGYGPVQAHQRAVRTTAAGAPWASADVRTLRSARAGTRAVPPTPRVQAVLNTLDASAGRPVSTPSTAAELSAARNQHIADYIVAAAKPDFDAAGRQIRGWTGGDSWRGGARLAGPARNNARPYASPSDAMLGALVTARRQRGVA